MHEIGVASEAYRICRAGADQHAYHRLVRVQLAIGELSAVEPELLRFAWEAVTLGGPDAGCELVIEWCRARQVCVECGDIEERVSGSWLKLCPRCGLPLRVEGGDQLDVMRWESEPAAATAGAPA